MTPPGSPGTASAGYRVPKPEGRHRAPPEPPPPDRWVVPIGSVAAVLVCASLIAIYAPAVAPEAKASAEITAPTATRAPRTVHIPLNIRPATVPSIGAEGAWDPDAALLTMPPENTLSRPESFSGVSASATAPTTTAAGLSGQATTTPAATTQPQATWPTVTSTRTTTSTTTSSPSSTAAATTTSSATPTEETTPVTTEPTPTETAEPTDDIGDVIDEILEDAAVTP